MNNELSTQISKEELVRLMQEGLQIHIDKETFKGAKIVETVEGYFVLVKDQMPFMYMSEEFLQAFMDIEVKKEEEMSKPQPSKPYYRKNERW